MIGSVVGSYRITAKIGEGGMGAVYRAVDEMLQRPVAIKVLRPELARQQQIIDRFRTEAVALARLSHPNIATVYGLIEQASSLYMVMEFVEGRTLETILAQDGRLPPEQAVRLCRDVLDALEHAHAMGVIHRDLKPANLMISRTGLVKVMDFGIARLAGTSRHTEYGRVIGTPLYMSPEQLRGEEVDPRSDVYSLGIVLYELLTGREAFQADSDYELLMAQLSRVPTRPMALLPTLPADLDAVVMRALSKARSDRFTSAATFRSALAPFDLPTTRSLARVVEDVPAEPVPTPASVQRPGTGAPFGDPPSPTRVADPAAPPPTRVADPAAAPPTRVAEPAPRRSAPPTRVAGERDWMRAGGVAAILDRYLPPGPRRYAAGAATVVLAGLLIYGAFGGSEPVPPPPAPAAVVDSAPAAATDVARSAEGDRSAGFGSGAGVVEPPRPDPSPIVPPAAPIVPPPPPPPQPSGPPGERPPARPAPAPPPAAPPPPPPPAAASPAVLGAAFSQGVAQIGNLIQGRSTGQLEPLYQRSTDQDRTNWDALSRLMQRFMPRLEGATMARQGEPAGGQAEAEYTAVMQWRTAFGSSRRVPVRLHVTIRQEGGAWTMRHWRFVGQPDLN